MSIEEILESLPDYAVDIKINAKNLLGTSVLTKKQAGIIFIASSFGAKNKTLTESIIEHFKGELTDVEINAAKIAASLMSMNNIYYRFIHLTANHNYGKMPAGLRMNSMAPAKHGIEVIDFELASIAVSAINGCGMCMDSHEKTLIKHEVAEAKIQEAIKIASVINALSAVLINL